jgi:hypothetical protein
MKIKTFAFSAFSLLFLFSFFNYKYVLAATGLVSTVTYQPETADGDNGWYISPVTATIAATDVSSGVKSISYKLDGGSTVTQNFSNSLNLVQNPSFEQTLGGGLVGWSFAGVPGASGSSDSVTYILGAKSAKIVSGENGWSGFNNGANYIPSSPFANLTASVWLKTSNVSGSGAYFKIYAATGSGPVLLATSESVTGTSNFTRISRSFNVSASNAYGVYLDLGVMGTGTIWYDGVQITATNTDTQVVQTFSSPGSHSLEYYATSNTGEEEIPHHTSTFKVDTVSPYNWRNFTTDREGNDHTLITQITVDDTGSGIDSTASKFQYSTDGGSTWGYYSNQTSCGSTWVPNGWLNINTSLQNGGLTATLTSPTVNFCSSNWNICKIVRYQASDLAGNSALKDVCIYGLWFKTGTGDVAARAGINYYTAGSTANTDGVVVSGGIINNFTSSNNWYFANYPVPALPTYSEMLTKFPASGGLPSGKLPKASGIYLNNASFTISNQTIPSGFSTSNFSAVVYINGNLVINTNYSVSQSSAIMFIVSGDVRIDKGVNSLAGFFLAGDDIDTSYNGNSNQSLTLDGSFLGDTLDINRNLNHNSDPSLLINYNPSYLLKLAPYLGEGQTIWKEVFE